MTLSLLLALTLSTAPEVWFDSVHLDRLPAPLLLRHADLARALGRLKAEDGFTVSEAGRSVEGRPLFEVSFGSGPRHVLLWSQMHGDEPTATSALLDVFELFRTKKDDPAVARILSALTIHALPMLNPDGAQRSVRRNAQGIDINRDAVALQTPEARALKGAWERHKPVLAFNLHNQNWRIAVADTRKPATISLLAPAFDASRSDNAPRIVAKKVCSVIRDALEPIIPGQIAKYDDAFEVRAFGDNFAKWGVPTVLIETGPVASAQPDRELVRLNFVALVTALEAFANGRVDSAKVDRCEQLPMNQSSGLLALAIRGATLLGPDGKGVTADVGVGGARVVRGSSVLLTGKIEDLGDLRVLGALEEVDGAGLTVVPLPSKRVKPGYLVKLGKTKPLSLGDPAELMLLRPAQGGAYRVERVVVFPQ